MPEDRACGLSLHMEQAHFHALVAVVALRRFLQHGEVGAQLLLILKGYAINPLHLLTAGPRARMRQREHKFKVLTNIRVLGACGPLHRSSTPPGIERDGFPSGNPSTNSP